jgi:hypothetical protein
MPRLLQFPKASLGFVSWHFGQVLVVMILQLYGFVLIFTMVTGEPNRMFFDERDVCEMLAQQLRDAGRQAECQPYRPPVLNPDWSTG